MFVEVVDRVRDIRFPVELMGADEGAGGAVPAARLAVISHGNGGSYQIYRALCATLAAGGWLVAGFDHPGNNRKDDRLKDSAQNLEDRPRHISLLIDTLLEQGLVAAPRIAVIGHSLGGYTALALAGAKAWTREGEPLKLQPDPRIDALVLLAPAAFWFMAPEAMRAVDLPILILQGERDHITPALHAELIAKGVAHPGQVTLHTVSGAGHFSFISPFPPAMRRPDFPPANDPEGFDRAAFHASYPHDVLAFLDRVLPA
jgi:predicted dienelactone hydrolase